jgi:hypothetical protein
LNHREEFKKYEEFKEFKEMLVGTMISKRTVTVLEIKGCPTKAAHKENEGQSKDEVGQPSHRSY